MMTGSERRHSQACHRSTRSPIGVPSLKRRPSVKPPVFVLASRSVVRSCLLRKSVEVSQLHRTAPAAEQAPHPSAGPAQAAVDTASGRNSPQRLRRIPFRLRVCCILLCCPFSTFLTCFRRVRLCVLRDLFTLLFALRVATSYTPAHDAGCDETVAPSGARPRCGQGTTRAHRPRRNPQNLLPSASST
jgi:hypothetical protein